MLKGVPQIISPELLKVLCEMGHSDQIVIADGNFPTESMGKDSIVIRCDGHGRTRNTRCDSKSFSVRYIYRKTCKFDGEVTRRYG